MTDIDVDGLIAVIEARGAQRRSLTAIAGAPGSGKSTLAHSLADRLNAREADSAAVLPMDGYHYDDRVLDARGWRARKGAPHTFDVGGLAHMLDRLRANDEAEIAVPVFDRSLEIARAGARIVPAAVRHLIVEGNYLLLDEGPWWSLAARFDTTVLLDEPFETLRARLGARWAALPPDEFKRKIEGNDLPNARTVIERSRAAEYVVRSAG